MHHYIYNFVLGLPVSLGLSVSLITSFTHIPRCPRWALSLSGFPKSTWRLIDYMIVPYHLHQVRWGPQRRAMVFPGVSCKLLAHFLVFTSLVLPPPLNLVASVHAFVFYNDFEIIQSQWFHCRKGHWKSMGSTPICFKPFREPHLLSFASLFFLQRLCNDLFCISFLSKVFAPVILCKSPPKQPW